MKFDLSKFKKINVPEVSGEPNADTTSAASTPNSSSSSSPKGTFRLEDVKANTEVAQPAEKNKVLAYGAYKYAEVIAANFADEEIDYYVAPRDIDASANKDALPIHFLFKKNGAPKVAVVVVTSNGYHTPKVVATRLWCEKKGIKYIRMYADGTYGDWITGESTGAFSNHRDLEEFCKNWVVDTISKALR